MIDAMNRATTLAELRDAARALDRIVMWNFWQIPDLWASREPISHWNKFGRPATQPPYFQADTLINGFVEWGPWPLWTWWDQSLPLKAA
jgi:ABC-type oligopeptide transport system substrate-binding subunit